ncbi:PREDICTED: uncharacterized protein LOC106816145, partial [Priapulus caudatus]|uniref:Uncharacterized protein LOC106816145 n=1 Tax=Priapulus caudatus TaxID=37621 RepID=A0ABM1EVG6_PRICU
ERECGYPGSGAGSWVKFSRNDAAATQGTNATYYCDVGLELFGARTRNCLPDGTWSDHEPLCALSIASNLPASQSSSMTDGRAIASWGNDDIAVFADGVASCTQTLPEAQPWWMVDLLDHHDVVVVSVANRRDEAGGRTTRSGDPSRKQHECETEHLCGTHPRTSRRGAVIDFGVTPAIRGGYVSIQIIPGPSAPRQNILSLLAQEQHCPFSNYTLPMSSVFRDRCFRFFRATRDGCTYDEARQHCREKGGDLAVVRDLRTQEYVAAQLTALQRVGQAADRYYVGLRRDGMV